MVLKGEEEWITARLCTYICYNMMSLCRFIVHNDMLVMLGSFDKVERKLKYNGKWKGLGNKRQCMRNVYACVQMSEYGGGVF